MIEKYGSERLLANSAGDWGPSKPTAIPDLISNSAGVDTAKPSFWKYVYDNPVRFFSQSTKFDFVPPEIAIWVSLFSRRLLAAQRLASRV